MTDSSTGGFLQPTTPATGLAPEYDKLFDTFLQSVVSGVTGLPGHHVRPRWQLNPPKRPSMETTWAAIGIQRIHTENAEHPHDGAANKGKGQDDFTTHEDIDVVCTFYGPHAWGSAAIFRDGLWMSQNREALYLAGCGVGDIGDMQTNAELINNQWLHRVDMTIRFVREISRLYPVLNLLSAQGTINGLRVVTELTQPWNTENYNGSQ